MASVSGCLTLVVLLIVVCIPQCNLNYWQGLSLCWVYSLAAFIGIVCGWCGWVEEVEEEELVWKIFGYHLWSYSICFLFLEFQNPGQRRDALRLLCLLLPRINRDTLQELLQFLSRVALHSNDIISYWWNWGTHTHTHTHTLTHTHTHTHTHSHTLTLTHTHSHTLTLTHTHTHSHTHSHSHTLTHTHTHIYLFHHHLLATHTHVHMHEHDTHSLNSSTFYNFCCLGIRQQDDRGELGYYSWT